MTNSDLKKLTTPQLYTALADAVRHGAAAMRRCAEICVELEERGESRARFAAIPGFAQRRAIASGALDPDVAWWLMGNLPLLNAITGIVPEDQRRVAALAQGNGTFKVATATGDMEIRLGGAGPFIPQVFGDGRMRSVAEQRKWLRANPPKPRAVRAAPETITATRDSVSGQFVAPEPVTPPEPPPSEWDLSAVLSAKQAAALQRLASVDSATPAECVRAVLIRHKLIPAR